MTVPIIAYWPLCFVSITLHNLPENTKRKNSHLKLEYFFIPTTKVPFNYDVFMSRYRCVKWGALYVQFAPKCLRAVCSLENCWLLTHNHRTKVNYIFTYIVHFSRCHFIFLKNEPFRWNMLFCSQIVLIGFILFVGHHKKEWKCDWWFVSFNDAFHRYINQFRKKERFVCTKLFLHKKCSFLKKKCSSQLITKQ